MLLRIRVIMGKPAIRDMYFSAGVLRPGEVLDVDDEEGQMALDGPSGDALEVMEQVEE